MQPIKCEEIVRATGGILISGSLDVELTNITSDSRKVNEGDLFIPIKGERFDGHDFITGALNSGAAAVITHRDTDPREGKSIIRVRDTLKALGDIAGYYRSKFKIPVVAITGSVGKTSTKDMVSSVLSQKYNVLKTAGNYNNEIGLPLTLFNLDSFHEACVLEMGMSGFDEISRLSLMAKPDVAIITNIGISHIEKLGSRQNILKAKMEILEGLKPDGPVILNGDDNLLSGLKSLLNRRTVYYGIEEGVDYQAYNIQTAGENGTNFEITLGNREYRVHIPVPGIHNVYNSLAGIAAGFELGVSPDKIIRGLEEYVPEKMRLNIISHNNIKIINDTYNASPQSMEAAINVLQDIGGNNRTVAVLGDMLEMGEWSFKAHMDVGRYAAVKGTDIIVAVGENGKNIARGAVDAGIDSSAVHCFNNNDEAYSFLKGLLTDGDTILVKGSRGMRMEKIVEKLLEK